MLRSVIDGWRGVYVCICVRKWKTEVRKERKMIKKRLKGNNSVCQCNELKAIFDTIFKGNEECDAERTM